MKENAGFKSICTLFIITAAMALLLAVVNGITAERIALSKEEKTEAALSAVMPEGAVLEEQLETYPDETGLVTAAYQTSHGYVFQISTGGYGGEITMTVGVDSNLAVSGVEIVSHSETPALGEKAAKGAVGEAFRGQFVGLSGILAVVKDGGTVEALTGATVTSRAVTKGVSAALACAAALEGGNP